MDFQPFVKFEEKDLPPDTPHLSLTIQATIELSLTLPFPIHFTIRRLAKGDATDSKPCIVRFNPAVDVFSPSGLVLLRHGLRSIGDPEIVPVDHGGNDPINRGDVPAVTGEDNDSSNKFLWKLPAPEAEVSMTATLPEKYYRAIQATKSPGPLRAYTLLYPGTELVQWEWGTIQEHEHEQSGREMKVLDAAKPRLVIPGGARISFRATRFVGEHPWPEREAFEAKHGSERANEAQKEWYERKLREERARLICVKPDRPFGASDRVPGAPHFTSWVEGPATVKSYKDMKVQLVFTYHGVTDTDGNINTLSTARPVTFHSWSLIDEMKLSTHLMRRRGGPEANWETSGLYEEDYCRLAIYDEPDVEVRVGQRHDDFASLRPGESWRWSQWMNSPTWMDIVLPRDSMPGDVFRSRVERAEVDWWDWGGMEEHSETAVKLPCYIKGDVTEPKNNGGRPRLRVPASEWFEFTLIE